MASPREKKSLAGRLPTSFWRRGAMLVLVAAIALAEGPLCARTDNTAPAQNSIFETRIAIAERELHAFSKQPERLNAELRLATLLNQSSRCEQAEVLANACLKKARELKLRAQEGHSLCILGSVHNQRGRADQAQTLLHQALTIFEETKDQLGMVKALNGLATVSMKAGEKQTARSLMERVVDLASTLEDKKLYMTALENLAYINGELNDFETAQQLYEKALKLQARSMDRVNEAALHTNIGQMLLLENKPAEAEPHFLLAVSRGRNVGDNRTLVVSLLGLSASARQMAKLEEAVACVQEIHALMVKLNQPADLQVRLAKEEALLAAARGDWENAYKTEVLYALLLKLEQDRMTESKARETSLRLEQRLKDQELQLKTEEGEKLEQALSLSQERLRMLWWAVAGLVLGAAGLLYLLKAKLDAEQRSHDLTGMAKETAEASAALKTRLLRMAAHDLRSPLSVIHLSAGLMSDSSELDPLVIENANTILLSTRKMNTMLEDLLTQVAAEDKSLRVAPVPTEMQEYLGETILYLKNVLKRKQQTIALVVNAPTPVLALVDPIRIWQVFENLISNASKFSPQETEITVILEARDGLIRCGIRDRGPGISLADQGRLFKAFSRGAAKPTGGERSTGLGLSIAKEIVDLHRGRILIDSTPGDGSTFWVELPKA